MIDGVKDAGLTRDSGQLRLRLRDAVVGEGGRRTRLRRDHTVESRRDREGIDARGEHCSPVHTLRFGYYMYRSSLVTAGCCKTCG